MRKNHRVMALLYGCLMVASVVACSNVTKDALDPMEYSRAGYYGKSQEEIIELLPGIEYGRAPSMVLESQISSTVSCKQKFYFHNNQLVEIQYEYLFDKGEDAERKFVELCRRLYEIDPNAIGGVPWGETQVTLEEFLYGASPLQTSKVLANSDDDLFWKEVVRSSYPWSETTAIYNSFCDAGNTRGLNREIEPEGWKNEYKIRITGDFYHWYVDLSDPNYTNETEQIQRTNAEFLRGKDARITLSIATWD